ncbi:MAG TPA: helicase HerA-like domain-containing protein, partial [Propionibacteriaceae bacterium]|nr:helicase HerA-like domain-containing protein [Propionibacteriaceae bacterium]
GIAASSLMAKYGQAVDRDSAQEMLARKVEQGAAAAEQEAEAERHAAEQAAADRQAAQQQREDERETAAPRRQPRQRSVIEEVASSSVFKQFVRSAGREIVRGLFATARRR